MKTIVNLGLRTEFSFKKTFGKVEDLVKKFNDEKYLGVADLNNTYSHYPLEKFCKDLNGPKPIFGVRLEVVKSPEEKIRGVCGPIYTFIAKNEDGLFEINNLVKTSYNKFYYKPMIGWDDLFKVSNNVFVIAETVETLDRLDYIALTTTTPPMMLDFDIPKVYLNNNFFPDSIDEKVYQLICGARKRGTDYYHQFDSQTYQQHILTNKEFYRLWKDLDAIENTHAIAEQCDVKLPKAPMVKYTGGNKLTSLCKKGAISKGIDIINEGEYKKRFEYEIDLIDKKDYTDYFLIVSDMINEAKQTMLVGPSRGSSAGSLVCYLCGITEVDPIEHDLLFERFIDINREDLPDIDVDFPDTERDKVIKNLFKIYGKENVCHISNINKMKAKSAINEFGIALNIPKYEVEALKDSIVDRSGGDARAKMAIADTIDTTEVGKEFIKKYPSMSLVKEVEGHASHAGKHAAGIIVCNDEITKYGGVNTRDGAIMMDKKGAEYLNLLKIDCLGLRTLSVLKECADIIGMNYLDYYKLPLDNDNTYKIFLDMRLSGIFQFEGQAMFMLCKQMGVENFGDIVAITALARPGPLHSGGANTFIERRIGKEPVTYISQHPSYVKHTEETYGVIIYQEQLMHICRDCGNMTWEEVAAIRRGSSKTLGKEFFDKYRSSFLKGTNDNGIPEQEAVEIWENMVTFGSWGMNKSHTVSYGYISYWCAYMKANHPLEFTAANLNHAKSPESALKILRDSYENEKIEYVPVDADNSKMNWSIKNGKLIGGLKNIKGIAEKKAKEILLAREDRKKYTPSMVKILLNPETPFDTLYPCADEYGDLYKRPRKYGINKKPTLINDIHEEGNYILIGKLISKDLRDLNEYNELVKRGGEVLTENSFFLKLVIEDDTDQIQCRINRYKFNELKGKYFSETGIENKTYYLIKGKIRGDWRIIDISAIYDLTIDENNILGDKNEC